MSSHFYNPARLRPIGELLSKQDSLGALVNPREKGPGRSLYQHAAFGGFPIQGFLAHAARQSAMPLMYSELYNETDLYKVHVIVNLTIYTN